MQFLGIDACRGGWFAVCLEGGSVRWSLRRHFAEVLADYSRIRACFVDIPIGLPESGDRLADVQARKALPSHLKSTIFNVPVRKAVYAAGKAEAKSMNKKLTGKSLSEQSLGIMPKIREVDEFLLANVAIRPLIRECHPETCFVRMADRPVRFRKKDLLGGFERLDIVSEFVPEARDLLESVRASHSSSSVVACDDMLDAFILAVTARECDGAPKFFPEGVEEPPKDGVGLPMAIWFHESDLRNL